MLNGEKWYGSATLLDFGYFTFCSTKSRFAWSGKVPPYWTP